jgi:Ankyrin repeats (3 copies)
MYAAAVPRALLAAIVALTFAIGVGWCLEHIGTIDLWSGQRACGAAPPAIAVWSFTHHARRPDERANLQEWVARNPRSMNSWYKARCQTPLHIAAWFDREDLAPVLLAAGADVNARDQYGDRPLHVAADYGHAAVARALLEGGAEVDARGANGRTPLHAAAQGITGASDIEGQLQVVRLLIARGADVNARATNSGFTPLQSAAPANRAMIDLLQASGAR